MSFTFAARTLLELGKELISSDETALYELIKNAVDAGARDVEVIVNVWLRSSDYRQALSMIKEERRSRGEVRNFIRSKVLDLERIDSAKLVDDLKRTGGDRNFLEKLEELYENYSYIEIRDKGCGMSFDDLTTVFLRIGTHSRRNENLRGARNLGDKGIGRLSAMRLGDRLHVKTSKSGERCWNLLDIDWTQFSHDEDIDATEIEIEPEIGDEKTNRKDQGTTIRISGLPADWDFVRFTDLLQGRVARMIDPFDQGRANRLIIARHNGKRVHVPSIPKSLLRSAHAFCRVKFHMNGDTPVIEGEIDYSYRQKKREIRAVGSEVYSLAQKPIKRRAKRGHAAFELVPIKRAALENLGAFECEIFWFNRTLVNAVEGLTSSGSETRQNIRNWSGGPMLYRYGFRILPYGNPDDDWLSLDELAFGASGFKLNRQQVIGRVLIDSPHGSLTEQTNREGLIESDTFNALKNILLWTIHSEFRGLINEVDSLERMEREAAKDNTDIVATARKRVDRALVSLRDKVGKTAANEIHNLEGEIDKLAHQSNKLVRRMEAVLKEADDEREKFVYLAGVGLITEFIFHELGRAVAYAMDIIEQGGVKQTTVTILQEQLKTLHKRIAAFDEMTGEKRQRKSTFDIADLVEDVLENHLREFGRHSIIINFEKSSSFTVRAVRGMVIQILENLIVNACYWLKQQKRFEPGFEPCISVVIDSDEGTVSVEDNGPGVTMERREKIFQPFVSNKPVGQGRGLGLYIARELAEYHGWALYMDAEAGRIRDGRSNMFVLETRQS